MNNVALAGSTKVDWRTVSALFVIQSFMYLDAHKII